MGAPEDAMAVVDGRGRCFEVEQLVVADASIMPAVSKGQYQSDVPADWRTHWRMVAHAAQ